MLTYKEVRERLGQLLIDMEQGVAPDDSHVGTKTATVTTTVSATIPKDAGDTLGKLAVRYRFGPRSIGQMNGSKDLPPLKPEMRQVAELAIQLTTQDFGMFEVGRSRARQAQLVKDGASRTMLSKHLVQPDGYSHAFDAVPVDSTGQFVWDWKLIYPVALAIDEAATRLGYADNIIWGGAWDRRLSDFGGSAVAYMKEVEAYTKRHAGKDFIDGPHYQWAE